MDLWVVATAAGAGCLAKYWQKLLKDGNSSSQMSSRISSFEEAGSPDHPFDRTSRRKKASGDLLADDGEVLNGRSSVMSQCNVTSSSNVASTSGFDCERLENFENYQDYYGLSISSLPQEVAMSINLQTFGHRNSINGNVDDSMTDHLPSSSRQVNFFQPTVRKIGSLRHKHSYGRFIRPLSSLESCVISHLYKEHIEMEEYILHSLQSPSKSTMRRFIVNDGTRIASRAIRDSFSVQVDVDERNFHKESIFEKNRNVYGVPLLPKIQSFKTSEMINIKAGRRQGGGLCSASQMHNEKLFHAKDRMILFCLGISMGLVSCFMTNKCETDKLKELLKHTENLVQDLQEELEMKDSLTVKELSNENCESRDVSENSFYSGKEQNPVPSAKFDSKELFQQNAEQGSLESLSKIEAELEAELQRLGLDIDASSMDRRYSDFPEFDAEFTRDFSEGELRADMFSGLSVTQVQRNQDASEITCSGNYAVSPWELSIRLHEVIQLRLEERVRELETALENSERKLQCIEAKQISFWNEFGQSESLYSSNEECPSAQPLVMNLSGEALAAYNEAYNELTNMDDSEDELMHSPSAVDESKHQQSHTATNGHPFAIPNGRTNGSTSLGCTMIKGKPDQEDSQNEIGNMEGHFLLGQQSNDVVDAIGDESSDCDYDDEMEKLLIKQIVEKTRMGSPVVLNAQRWLFSSKPDTMVESKMKM